MLWSLLLKLPGLAGGLLGYLEKRADAAVATHRTNVTADVDVIRETLRAEVEARRIAAAGRGPELMLWVIITPLALHLWAIVLDSIFRFDWVVDALPKPFDAIEHQVLLAVAGVAGAVGVARRVFNRG